MGQGLRLYPVPYLEFKLKPQHLFHVQSQTVKLSLLNPEWSNYKVRSTGERMLVHMAFADIYGKRDAFLKKDIEDFAKQHEYDYMHGKYHVSVVPGTVNEKYEQTGTTVKFRFSSRIAKSSKTDWIVLVAVNMPNIQIIGYITPEEAKKYIKGYSCTVYAGDSNVKPVSELPLENKRQRGTFV